MPFHCPYCRTLGSLQIDLTIELPPDARSDEITLQVIDCSQCGFRGLAVYSESRRGASQIDTFEHSGFSVREADLQMIQDTIRSCPDPYNARCQCPAHRSLGQANGRGVWQGLKDVERLGSFTMRM